MGTRHDQQTGSSHYGRFTAAVMVYVVGIAAFAAWSCLKQFSAIEDGGGAYPEATQRHAIQVFLVEALQILFLLVMSAPLIASYHRARARSGSELAELHQALQSDYRKLQVREKELEDAVHDLKRFNALASGREERILELKNEVNDLLQELNRSKRYSASPDE